MNNTKAWEVFSSAYQDGLFCSIDDFHYAMCLGGEKDYHLLPSVHNATICDVGSGTGENAAYLARSAKKVIGIEPSHSLCKIARSKFVSYDNLSFECIDFLSFHNPSMLCFDLITFIGSLDYIVLREEFFTHLRQMTRQGSFVVISKMHPLWTTLFNHELDDIRLDRDYFTSRIDMVNYAGTSFSRIHYSFSEFAELFVSHGWKLDRFLEPPPVPFDQACFRMGRCYEDERLMSRMAKYPMTLLVRFKREC